jgi:hypothetical protein
VGLTVNYVSSTRVEGLDKDWPSGDDTLIADSTMCDTSGPAPQDGWQTSLLRSYWDDVIAGGPEQRPKWTFSDDCPDPDPQFRYHLRVYVPRLP